MSVYIEQMTTVRVLSNNKMLGELEGRQRQIAKMMEMLLEGGNGSLRLREDVEEIDRMMKRVPDVIREAN